MVDRQRSQQQAFIEILHLKQIERAMKRQKETLEQYLDKYEISTTWDKIKKAFLFRGYQTRLRRLVKTVPCDIEASNSVYFLPENKGQKILVCYNKISSYSDLQKQLGRKLILSYDVLAKKIDLNNLSLLAHSEIKALHLSKTCSRSKYWMILDDKECFNKHIQKICNQKQYFKGKQSIFNEVIDEALHDVQPLNELKF